jgi:hypothetical protein
MERSKAVEAMMRDIRDQVPSLPQSLAAILENRFDLMWQVGYDHRGAELTAHNKKPVRLLDHNGLLIETFPSVVDAAKATGYGATGIYSAIERRSRTKDGYYWEYAQLKE